MTKLSNILIAEFKEASEGVHDVNSPEETGKCPDTICNIPSRDLGDVGEGEAAAPDASSAVDEVVQHGAEFARLLRAAGMLTVHVVEHVIQGEENACRPAIVGYLDVSIHTAMITEAEKVGKIRRGRDKGGRNTKASSKDNGIKLATYHCKVGEHCKNASDKRDCVGVDRRGEDKHELIVEWATEISQSEGVDMIGKRWERPTVLQSFFITLYSAHQPRRSTEQA